MLHLPFALALASSPVAEPTALLASQPTLAASELALFVSAAAPTLVADADAPFSYTYLEVGAVSFDVDVIDDEADVHYGRASIELLGFLYVFGGHSNLSIDYQNTDTDLIELGAGAHVNVVPKLDLFGEVGWLYADVSSDLTALDDTTNGYEVFGGARWMVLPWSGGGLELNGGLGYVDLENQVSSDDKTTFWEVGVRVHVLEVPSVGATYSKLEDDDQVSAGVRLSF
ncbi:MAG: hypothetical protein HZA52_00375 [Planctomycetes bacterium]|nr:hypothetical protein [Planctomycetota bacterium]